MIPRATYRLQFHKEFPFAAALPLAAYLERLGISHVYASPILKARPGSLHGYDVIDPTAVNPELGGEAGFRELAAELRAHDLGIILDIVPNHMAADDGNRWWMDVLERGRASHFAGFFDIDWDALDAKVLLAILGKPYWETLEAGEIRIVRERSGKLCAEYFDRRLPLRPEDQQIDFVDLRDATELHALLERQHWRLAWWRTANDIINWRRFFDVPDLIALDQDNENVFDATHAKIFDLYREGLIDGVRVDHVDGLANPGKYCRGLRQRLEQSVKERPEPDPHPYIVVEKILGAGEELPADWGVDGTTGYDFMNEVSAVQHEPRGAEPLAQLWHGISGRSSDFYDEERLARGEIVTGSFESALSRTTDAFFTLAQGCRIGRDIAHATLRRGIVRILQELRVYRTYPRSGAGSAEPREQFTSAVVEALGCAGGDDRAAIAFVDRIVSGKAAAISQNRGEAVRRFNQLSAPVAAKAVEDTAFYRYGRLLSRNDVGFDPGKFARAPADFHAAMANRARSFPHALLTTATHDHKRGEDVRARLAVLSEIPDEWKEVTREWMHMNIRHRAPAHDFGDEYQLYQMLVGSWPLNLDIQEAIGLAEFRDRILGWRQKALREAKLRTSWLDPDAAYETADAEFIRAILDVERSSEFLKSFLQFVRRIAPGGALNGLVQTALRCTVPGVPDCYQGCEFWDFSLVDPDNRRPVDYVARVSAIHEQKTHSGMLVSWGDGQIKQSMIANLFSLRGQRPNLFSDGEYLPLAVRGDRSDNVLAFARVLASEALLVAVPIRCANQCTASPFLSPDYWARTEIEIPGDIRRVWRHLFDGQFESAANALSCRDLFARFPVAVLI